MRFHLRSLTTVLVLALAPILLLACGDDDGGDGMTDPDTTGDVRAQVTTDGTNAAGVTVRLYESGAATATRTGTTGNDGTATFQDLEPGSWEVEVEVPDGTELGDGEDDRKTVTVTAGQTAQVSFALQTLADGNVVEVLLTGNLTFSPAEVTISPGTTVRWRNAETIFHTITPDGHTEWASVSMNQQDEIFTHTFETAGTYPYFCQPHQAQGMTGTVIVQ